MSVSRHVLTVVCAPIVAMALCLSLLLVGCGPVEPASKRDAARSPGGEAALDARFPGRDPSLRWDPEASRLHVVYVDETDGRPRVVYRRLGDGASDPVPVSPPAATVSSHGEVPPVLEVLADGTLLVAYTVEMPGRFKGEIHLQRSTDDGVSWSPPRSLHDDGGRVGSHSFLDVARTPGGALFAWLDDRAGRQGLVVTTTADGGRLEPNRLVDERTCECCRTALLAQPDGPLWLAYRDLDERSVRDISLLASDNGGQTFAGPVAVSPDRWQVEGCPHTGPRLAAETNGRLWVAWFSGADPGIYVAASADGGRTFTPRRLVAGRGEDVSAVAHPEIGVLPDGRLAIFYEAARPGGHTVEARLATPRAGSWSTPRPVAADGVYPRFVRRGEHAVLAWTTYGAGDGSQIRVLDWRLALP